MTGPIPGDWLPNNILKPRIICHWTVTGYEPEPVSLDSYHLLIDGNGKLHKGYRNINEPAPHTYGHNSSIGVSLLCMGGYQSPSQPGPYPPTKAQWETLVRVVRQLSREYGIRATRSTILMHGEVTEVLGPDQWGKWDIGWLPHLGLHGAATCGNALRRAVEEDDADDIMVTVRGGRRRRHHGYGDIMVTVLVYAGDGSVHGMLQNGATLVPIRKFCALGGGLSSLTIKAVGSRKVFLGWPGTEFSLPLENVAGTGYVRLADLCEAIGWKARVEEWTPTARVVRAGPT